jgi:AcrR family transcriptional regulator
VSETRAVVGAGAGAEGRMTRGARREHLLDAAADMLLAGDDVTMEGLAARAGVSKSLPYVHFDNADGVVEQLWAREMDHFTSTIVSAVDAETDAVRRLRVAVDAYFNVIDARGRLLHVLAGRRTAQPDATRARERFVGSLLADAFGLSTKAARGFGSVVLGALEGAVTAYAHRELSRAAATQAVIDVAMTLGASR